MCISIKDTIVSLQFWYRENPSHHFQKYIYCLKLQSTHDAKANTDSNI